jgi:excisionase family DNA binding protein
MGEYRDKAQDRVTIQEAAQRLGVKEDAVRKRIQRGSMRHEKAENGRVYVWVDTAQDTPPDEPDASRDEYRDTAQDERVEDLREQVAYLRRQLDEEREARRRADTILVQLSAANAEQARTIRALEAPAAASGEPADDPETVEEEPEGSEPRPATTGPQTSPLGPQRITLRGLRRRIFGW